MKFLVLLCAVAALMGCSQAKTSLSPVDYVNPYAGNISHLLVPTYPTVHLPNSMLRVYPERADFTGDVINGLPLIVTSHRGRSAFNLSPYTDGDLRPSIRFSYDREQIRPYYYSVYLDEQGTEVEYAPSHQSAVYDIRFSKPSPRLIFNAQWGGMSAEGNAVSGWQQLDNDTRVYLYAVMDTTPEKIERLDSINGTSALAQAEGRNACVVVSFPENTARVGVNYGISFISVEQAKANMEREVQGKTVAQVAATAKDIWNKELSKIKAISPDKEDLTLFYTSLYRCYERPVCISEDGYYFSAFDHKVHEDDGAPFYTDDWIWDTYRATHPLRILIDPKTETDVVRSFIRMAEQMDNFWMPTFPEITGDSRRMNSNHAVATVADAWAKGLQSFDLEKAYTAGKQGVMDKTLAPWSSKPGGWLNDFYKEHGYIPAIRPGDVETVPEVHPFEQRQPIAVTLGTAYDQWALSLIAAALGHTEDAEYFRKASYNYRNVFNPETHFFHPKDKDGNFIMPFDYRYDGGQGTRYYYGENNGWVYRWDVPHRISDLVAMMGGAETFDKNLDIMYREPLGKSKYAFYATIPDHTGNVGQFSMANEPSLHIPYLYVYAGKPWKTQKRIHTLINMWFRNDLMGMPGDEDGGGMSAFVVFSMMGFYPVTPGLPMYVIGSPCMEEVSMNLADGKIFTVKALNYAKENKYIQSATLNGKPLDKSWISHDDVMNGGKLELVMGPTANRQWAAGEAALPPSGE